MKEENKIQWIKIAIFILVGIIAIYYIHEVTTLLESIDKKI